MTSSISQARTRNARARETCEAGWSKWQHFLNGWAGLPEPAEDEGRDAIVGWRSGAKRRADVLAAGLRVPKDGKGAWTTEDRERLRAFLAARRAAKG